MGIRATPATPRIASLRPVRAVLAWGFSPRDVQVPILLWHGAEDYIVPVAHAEHLAELMPGATIEIKPNAAHLANLALGAEVLASIVRGWPDDET